MCLAPTLKPENRSEFTSVWCTVKHLANPFPGFYEVLIQDAHEFVTKFKYKNAYVLRTIKLYLIHEIHWHFRYLLRVFKFLANHKQILRERLPYRSANGNIIDTLLTHNGYYRYLHKFETLPLYQLVDGYTHTALYIARTGTRTYVHSRYCVTCITCVYADTFRAVIQKRRVDVHRQTVR